MVELLTRDQRKEPAGFTLIEVMVSLTILAIGILVLGGLLTRSARSAEAASAVSYQIATMGAELARNDAIPYAQLVVGTVCDTVTTQPFPRIRCVTVTDLSATRRRVSVVVTPTDNPLLRRDSIVVERSTRLNSPLKTP
jgi:prepilin-type N-terminal cleavage/methylation domain-containing protein